ncbi:unnamed protein product, partial [Mesorhabditis belari]|uniref:Uncharacterized protein n=1 Tax=Mesorhabditis belari TaxID=2138241 RepID=A0AAF3ECW2_9BILA
MRFMFLMKVSEFSIAGGDKCFPLDIEWTPTSEQDLAVCFNNAIYVFNEELHKLNGESRVPNGDHENSKEARLTIRRGMSARWGAGLPPPIICGWDESGRKFTYIYRKSRFTWDTQENRVTRRNMDDKITPTFSTVERLNGQNGKRWIVGETENGYEVWSFSHHKLHREYEALISLPDTPFPIKFKSLMNPIRDIQYVEPSPRPDGWKGGICIAINNQMGQQSQLFVWLKDRPIRPLDLKGEESAIRCLRFKRQPHYLAALTDRYLDVYKVDGEQLKITYRYDLLKISPFSGKVQWNDDGQKIVLHQKNPRTGMIGITALIRTKIDAPAPAVVVEKL